MSCFGEAVSTTWYKLMIFIRDEGCRPWTVMSKLEGFLNLSSINLLGQIILCCEGQPAYCRMFRILAAFLASTVASTLGSSMTVNISISPLWGSMTPVWEWAYWMDNQLWMIFSHIFLLGARQEELRGNAHMAGVENTRNAVTRDISPPWEIHVLVTSLFVV